MNEPHADHPLPVPAEAPAAAEAGAPVPEGTAAAAPKRRRAPRKPKPEGAEAREGAAGAGDAAQWEAPSAEAVFGKPREEQPAALAPEGGESLRVVEGAGDGTPGGTEARAASGAPDGERGPRRGRNRRRGRRGGERRPEGAPGEGGEADRLAPPAAEPRVRLPAQPVEDVFADVLSGAFDAALEAPAEAGATAPAGPLISADHEAAGAADAPAPQPAPVAVAAADPTIVPAPPEVIDAGDTAEGASDAAPASDAVPEAGADARPPGHARSADADGRPAGTGKRVLAPEPDAPKLHKVLAQSGLGSRRDLEQMIIDGRVAVNGSPAHTGQRISYGDRISIDGKPVRVRIAPPTPRVLAYHKPAGEVVTHDDPQQRPTVFRRLPRLPQGKWQSVGRLDINTEGLLLFTNSGELAHQLMHPRFGVEREYAVRSLGLLSEESKARLLEGVEIEGQRCAFKSIEDGGGEGANHWYRVVISEGRNREVRKLFDAVGHAVSRLIRIRYGSVVLPKGLRRGIWVDLDEHDVRALRRAAGQRPADGPPREGDRRDRPNRRDKRNRRDRNDGPPRGPRNERFDRPERGERVEHADLAVDRPDHEEADFAFIPSPLQQTFDKRAIQQERAQRREIPEDGPIPNPLQQTYDKRALQRDRQPRREYSEDGPIPDPLQQTYDKRFAQGGGGGGGGKPGGPRRGKGGGGGFGRGQGPGPGPGKAQGKGGRGQGQNKGAGGAARGGPHEPDPMRTSVGYIGADAFHRKLAGGRGGGGGGGGNRGGRGR